MSRRRCVRPHTGSTRVRDARAPLAYPRVLGAQCLLPQRERSPILRFGCLKAPDQVENIARVVLRIGDTRMLRAQYLFPDPQRASKLGFGVFVLSEVHERKPEIVVRICDLDVVWVGRPFVQSRTALNSSLAASYVSNSQCKVASAIISPAYQTERGILPTWRFDTRP